MKDNETRDINIGTNMVHLLDLAFRSVDKYKEDVKKNQVRLVLLWGETYKVGHLTFF